MGGYEVAIFCQAAANFQQERQSVLKISSLLLNSPKMRISRLEFCFCEKKYLLLVRPQTMHNLLMT